MDQNKKRLNILQVVPYFYPAWAYGGIPRVAYELSRELVRRGHRVTVFTTDVLDRASRCDASGSVAMVDGIEVHYFRNVSNVLAYSLQVFLPKGMRRALRDRIGEFDIVHLHGHRNFLNNLAHYYATRSGKPYLLSGHGTVPAIERRLFIKRIFDRFFSRHVLRDAALFLAVSDHEVVQYEEAGIDRRRIKMIYNGIDTEAYRSLPAPGLFRSRYGIHNNKIVLYLGKITPRKGIDVLIRAFARLHRSNARLVIAGNDMGFQRTLEAIVREHTLQDRVIFTGLLTGEDKLAAYRDADVLVYAAIHEIFGLVPFEAMLSGAPVIVTDDCGCGEIIRRESIGYITRYNDVSNLCDGIADVLDHPEAARQTATRGAEFIRKSLSWDTIAAKYEKAYMGIVSR